LGNFRPYKILTLGILTKHFNSRYRREQKKEKNKIKKLMNVKKERTKKE
jgi:hypothetical protein